MSGQINGGVLMQYIFITGIPCHQARRRCRIRSMSSAAAAAAAVLELAAAACPCGRGTLLSSTLLPALSSSHAALDSASSSATNITWAASQRRSTWLESRASKIYRLGCSPGRVPCDSPTASTCDTRGRERATARRSWLTAQCIGRG